MHFTVYNELANLAKTPTFLPFFMIAIFSSILFSFNFLNSLKKSTAVDARQKMYLSDTAYALHRDRERVR